MQSSHPHKHQHRSREKFIQKYYQNSINIRRNSRRWEMLRKRFEVRMRSKSWLHTCHHSKATKYQSWETDVPDIAIKICLFVPTVSRSSQLFATESDGLNNTEQQYMFWRPHCQLGKRVKRWRRLLRFIETLNIRLMFCVSGSRREFLLRSQEWSYKSKKMFLGVSKSEWYWWFYSSSWNQEYDKRNYQCLKSDGKLNFRRSDESRSYWSLLNEI